MKEFFKAALLVVIGIILGFVLVDNPNAKLEYGDTGAPKNCRAIIKENLDGYYLHVYSAEEALDSIGRNCGEYGYSWES